MLVSEGGNNMSRRQAYVVKFRHYTRKGDRKYISAKQLLKWNSPASKDTKEDKRRKVRNLLLARSKVQTPEMYEKVELLIASQKLLAVTRKKPSKEFLSEVKEEKKGLELKGLIGIAYESKGSPFYAEMLFTINYSNKNNFKPEDLLVFLKDKLSEYLVGWFSHGAHQLMQNAEWFLNTDWMGQRYGVVEEKEVGNNTSDFSGDIFVAYQLPPGDKKRRLDTIRSSNILDA